MFLYCLLPLFHLDYTDGFILSQGAAECLCCENNPAVMLSLIDYVLIDSESLTEKMGLLGLREGKSCQTEKRETDTSLIKTFSTLMRSRSIKSCFSYTCIDFSVKCVKVITAAVLLNGSCFGSHTRLYDFKVRCVFLQQTS